MRVSCRAVGSQLCVRSMALACKDFMSRATNPTKWIQTFSTCSTQIMHCKVASNSCHSLLHLPIVWIWFQQFCRCEVCVCGYVHSLIVFCCFVWHHFLLKWLMTNSGIWFFLSPIQDCTCGLIDPRQLYSQLRVSNLAWKAAFRAVMGDCFLNDTRWQRPQRFVWKNMGDGRLCDTPKFLNRREILSGFLIDWLSRMSKYGTFTVASGGISYQILDVTCELDTRFCMELRWI